MSSYNSNAEENNLPNATVKKQTITFLTPQHRRHSSTGVAQIDIASASQLSVNQKIPTMSRSMSYELPTRKSSNSSRKERRKPFMVSRQSFARSISSLSVYSHFAGERFDRPRPERTVSTSALSSKSSKTQNCRDNVGHSNHYLQTDYQLKAANSGRDNETATSPSSCANSTTEFACDSGHSTSHEKVEEDIECQAEKDAEKVSTNKAMVMFLKAFIGSGVLFLPKAYENGGLALSNVLMILVAAICLVAFQKLVTVQLLFGGSYADLGLKVFSSRCLMYIIKFFLVISQVGFVCSYLVFIAGNLYNIVNVLSHCNVHVQDRIYIWLTALFILPTVLIRRMNILGQAALVADAFILLGLGVVLYFAVAQLQANGVGPGIKAVNPVDFGLMIGTATFSFEGIGLVIPIVEIMKQPERFPFVLTVGMAIVCSVYILIGSVSYLAYGNQIQAAVVYNLPRDNPLTISVQLLYSLAILLTAPLMLAPAVKILESHIFADYLSGHDNLKVKWSKNLFRSFMVALCAAVAYSVGGKNLDIFVSLVGSIACVPLCFIFPGLFHFKITKSKKEKMVDVLLCIFGIFVLFYTLTVTIINLILPKGVAFVLPPYCPLVPTA